MDFRSWPLNKIMQLPDECFGSRWPIFFAGGVAAANTGYYISEMALPERCVIWELFIHLTSQGGMAIENWDMDFIYKLGDQLPTAANLAAMETLFKGVDFIQAAEKTLRPFSGVLRMRMPVASSGRRICLAARNNDTEYVTGHTGLVISSVPTEVPDCLFSGKDKSRS